MPKAYAVEDKNEFRLYFRFDEALKNDIKAAIPGYYEWSPGNKCWVIARDAWSIIENVLEDHNYVAYGCATDYDAFFNTYGRDPDWTAFVNYAAGQRTQTTGGQSQSSAVSSPDPDDPYRTLYVYPDAPVEVIRAAYRALAIKFHPDKGGDVNVMARINHAMDKIKVEKGIT